MNYNFTSPPECIDQNASIPVKASGRRKSGFQQYLLQELRTMSSKYPFLTQSQLKSKATQNWSKLNNAEKNGYKPVNQIKKTPAKRQTLADKVAAARSPGVFLKKRRNFGNYTPPRRSLKFQKTPEKIKLHPVALKSPLTPRMSFNYEYDDDDNEDYGLDRLDPDEGDVNNSGSSASVNFDTSQQTDKHYGGRNRMSTRMRYKTPIIVHDRPSEKQTSILKERSENKRELSDQKNKGRVSFGSKETLVQRKLYNPSPSSEASCSSQLHNKPSDWISDYKENLMAEDSDSKFQHYKKQTSLNGSLNVKHFYGLNDENDDDSEEDEGAILICRSSEFVDGEEMNESDEGMASDKERAGEEIERRVENTNSEIEMDSEDDEQMHCGPLPIPVKKHNSQRDPEKHEMNATSDSCLFKTPHDPDAKNSEDCEITGKCYEDTNITPSNPEDSTPQMPLGLVKVTIEKAVKSPKKKKKQEVELEKSGSVNQTKHGWSLRARKSLQGKEIRNENSVEAMSPYEKRKYLNRIKAGGIQKETLTNVNIAKSETQSGLERRESEQNSEIPLKRKQMTLDNYVVKSRRNSNEEIRANSELNKSSSKAFNTEHASNVMKGKEIEISGFTEIACKPKENGDLLKLASIQTGEEDLILSDIVTSNAAKGRKVYNMRKRKRCDDHVDINGGHVNINGEHVNINGEHVNINGEHVNINGDHVVPSTSKDDTIEYRLTKPSSTSIKPAVGKHASRKVVKKKNLCLNPAEPAKNSINVQQTLISTIILDDAEDTDESVNLSQSAAVVDEVIMLMRQIATPRAAPKPSWMEDDTIFSSPNILSPALSGISELSRQNSPPNAIDVLGLADFSDVTNGQNGMINSSPAEDITAASRDTTAEPVIRKSPRLAAAGYLKNNTVASGNNTNAFIRNTSHPCGSKSYSKPRKKTDYSLMDLFDQISPQEKKVKTPGPNRRLIASCRPIETTCSIFDEDDCFA